MSKEITFQSAATAAGNGNSLSCDGLSVVGVQTTGLSASTITFEGTIDNTNWVAVLALNATPAWASTATTNGLFTVPVAGLSRLRCRISTYGGGDTITVKGIGSVVPAGIQATS